MQSIHRLAHLAQRPDGGVEWACPQYGRYLIRYPDSELVLAAGAPDPVHILSPEYRNEPSDGPTISEFDEQFLRSHAMAWSAYIGPNQGQAMKVHRSRILPASGAVGALIAASSRTWRTCRRGHLQKELVLE
jgi:hypothetical protein